jgi:hypothetical protein
MLLLGLEMLAQAAPRGELATGAGIRKEWLSSPMRVSDVHTRLRRVSWQRDGRKPTVVAGGKPSRFRPAGVFSRSLQVNNPSFS